MQRCLIVFDLFLLIIPSRISDSAYVNLYVPSHYNHINSSILSKKDIPSPSTVSSYGSSDSVTVENNILNYPNIRLMNKTSPLCLLMDPTFKPPGLFSLLFMCLFFFCYIHKLKHSLFIYTAQYTTLSHSPLEGSGSVRCRRNTTRVLFKLPFPSTILLLVLLHQISPLLPLSKVWILQIHIYSIFI
jgi:hypothetical protein